MSILLVKDTIGPTITILSPEEGSSYAATVVVTGFVMDSATQKGDAGEVQKLSCEVLATNIGSDIAMGQNGSFSFKFETTNLSGQLIVKVEAVDWNNNSAHVFLTLVDEGAIPSFSAVSGNGNVTLTWDPVPMASSYSLFYTENGTFPTENNGYRIDEVQSPLELTGLKNGMMHVFRLFTHSTEGEDNWSHVVRSIPLSPFTLAPRVKGNFKQIEIEWNQIPATDEYEVLRSETADGEFVPHSGIVRGNSFIDFGVRDGQFYYYKVQPALEDSIESVHNGGETSQYPSIDSAFLGSFSTSSYAFQVERRGNYAYITDFDFGLYILDVSDPNEPFLISKLELPFVFDIVLQGDFAYLSFMVLDTGLSGFRILDISNPAVPIQVGEYHTDGFCLGLTAKDNYVYATNVPFFLPSSIHIVDVSVPSQPDKRSEYTGNFQWLQTKGDLLILVSGEEFSILDISVDPENPTPRGTEQVTGAQLYSLYIDGDLAFSGDQISGALYIFDIFNPDLPQHVGTYDTSGETYSVKATNNIAYMADGLGGLHLVDYTDPTTPVFLARYDTPGECFDVNVHGDYIYVLAGYAGFHVIYRPSTSVFSVVGSEPMDARDIIVHDSYLYVIDDDSGFTVIDVSNPANPDTRGNYPVGFMLREDVAASGNYAFIYEDDLLKVLDVTDKDGVSMVSETIIGTNSNVAYIEVFGNFAHVVSGRYYNIIDISNIENPKIVGQYIHPSGDSARGIAITENYAYISFITPEIRVIDISNKTFPNDVNTWSGAGLSGPLALRGDYLYISDSDLSILDISDPKGSLQTVGSYSPENNTRNLFVSGNLVFITDASAGIKVIDVSDPATPVLVGKSDPIYGYGVTFSGKDIYVASQLSGLNILNILP
jgi:hypothetical protein